MAVSGCFYGAPGEIRTPDLVVRSHALYPTELRAPVGTTEDSHFTTQLSRVLVTIDGLVCGEIHLPLSELDGPGKWRRGWDSNPRWSYQPHTPLAGERLQPLGHLSVGNDGLIIGHAQSRWLVSTAGYMSQSLSSGPGMVAHSRKILRSHILQNE